MRRVIAASLALSLDRRCHAGGSLFSRPVAAKKGLYANGFPSETQAAFERQQNPTRHNEHPAGHSFSVSVLIFVAPNLVHRNMVC